MAGGIWKREVDGPQVWRRSLYVYRKRGLAFPMFEVFDMPDPNTSCGRRNVSTVPTQALTLLNNEFVLIQARHLAARVAREAGDDPVAQIRMMHRIVLSREPGREELTSFQAFLQKQQDYHVARASAGDSGGGSADSAALAALTDVAHVMLNANEFVYIN